MYYEKSRNYIYKNARPLDIARWKYLFENGSKEDALTALAVYQNDDGGFGHALEPDCWNPNSSPVQTWVATRIIKEINLEDKNHPIIQGILKYLDSGKDFDGHTWLNSVATNNDYPHAPWWKSERKTLSLHGKIKSDFSPNYVIPQSGIMDVNYEPSQEISYNPTASFIGFIIKFADKNSKLYELACTLAKEAYSYFKENFPLDSMHTTANFVELYEYIKESYVDKVINIDEFKTLLQEQIKQVITYDTSRWTIDYVCKPSLFITNKASDFYKDNKEICDYECDFIINTQDADGTWAVTWSWDDYMEQWYISKNWWKSDIIIRNMKYIKCM